MSQSATAVLCPQDKINAVVARLGGKEPGAMGALDALLAEFPQDGRLHFMKGSLLANAHDFAGAHAAMKKALELNPDYALARFQLGLSLLCNGEAREAMETLGPLHRLAPGHFLNMFAAALAHLVRDEFADALRLLKDGMVRNRDIPALNANMQLLINAIEEKIKSKPAEETISSVQLLLNQALRSTRH